MGALQLHSISPSLHVCLEPVPSCVHHNPSRALGDLNISQSSPIGKLILKFWHQRVQKRWHHHSQNLLWCVDKGGHRRSVFSDGGGESLSGVRSSSFVRLLPLLQPPQQPILHPTDAISSISSIQKKRKLEEVLNWRSTFISEHLWRLFHFVGRCIFLQVRPAPHINFNLRLALSSIISRNREIPEAALTTGRQILAVLRSSLHFTWYRFYVD
ncbi:hypothetical protein SDJN03_05837, partial [Cucurbita argyrosperma subsp. sororia]